MGEGMGCRFGRAIARCVTAVDMGKYPVLGRLPGDEIISISRPSSKLVKEIISAASDFDSEK